MKILISLLIIGAPLGLSACKECLDELQNRIYISSYEIYRMESCEDYYNDSSKFVYLYGKLQAYCEVLDIMHNCEY